MTGFLAKFERETRVRVNGRLGRAGKATTRRANGMAARGLVAPLIALSAGLVALKADMVCC